MVNNNYYIHNALIVNENQRKLGAILIQDGLISEIFQGQAPAGLDFRKPPSPSMQEKSGSFPG